MHGTTVKILYYSTS